MVTPFFVKLVDAGPWDMLESVGSLVGLAVAIAVPAYFEISRRRREDAVRREQARATYHVLTTVIEVLASKQMVAQGEVNEMSAVLSNIDLRVVPADAVEAVVNIRNRVAVCAAEAARTLGRAGGGEARINFDAAAARGELARNAAAFGVKGA